MEDYNAINSFPRAKLPDGFRTLLFSLSKELLREQPTNLYEFCAEYFGRRLLIRSDSWVTFKERYNMRKKEREQQASKGKTTPATVTESTADLSHLEEITPEQEEAVVKIQAGVRGMLTRRSIMRSDVNAEADLERWLHPQKQLQRDLLTVSESLSFAKLESEEGKWEACQRWLHPGEQLQRDFDTEAEPVECAHLRDRGPSLEDATSLERGRGSGSAQQRRSSLLVAVSPQHSDIDVAGETAVLPEASRAGSPPELRSPSHSAVSVAGAAGALSPTPPARGPSVASVQSVERGGTALPPAHSPDERARSLETVNFEQAALPDVLGEPTAGSLLHLAGHTEARPAIDAAQRAGSPPEAATPRHSDVEVAGGSQSPPPAAQRAGSPPEAVTPQHSDVEVAGAAVNSEPAETDAATL